MITLLPRLPAPAAEKLLDDLLPVYSADKKAMTSLQLPEAVRFAATGGTPISTKQLEELREGILSIAEGNGFGHTGSRIELAAFDAQASGWLATQELLSSGDALRDDVWAFIGTCLAPDIVHWRFGLARERYLGGVRNTFQRLWLRGRSLDRGIGHFDRWGLLTELTEDALVQITERPSLGGDPALALAIGEGWMRAAKQVGRGEMEALMRKAALRLRVWNEVRSLAALDAMELACVVDTAFSQVRQVV